MQDEMLTIQEALRAFRKYVDTLEQVRYGAPTTADIDHSSLLYRLLHGEKFHSVPPPRFHSYPCYQLGEGEPVRILEVHEHNYDCVVDGQVVKGNKIEITIDQNSSWERIDNRTVRYTETGEWFRFDKPFEQGKPWNYDLPKYNSFGSKAEYDEFFKHEGNFLHLQKVPIKAKTVKFFREGYGCTGRIFEVIGEDKEYWIYPDETRDNKRGYITKINCVVVDALEV